MLSRYTTTLATISAIVTTGVRRVPMLSFSGNTGGAGDYRGRAAIPALAGRCLRGLVAGPVGRVAVARGLVAARPARSDPERPLGEQALLVDVGAVAEQPVHDAPPRRDRGADARQEAPWLVLGTLAIPFGVHPRHS